MRTRWIVTAAAALATAVAGPASAQLLGLQVTPTVGAHYPGRDLSQLGDEVAGLEGDAFAMGMNLEFSAFRGSLVYGSAATFTRRGVDGEVGTGEGRLLALAADIVVRPIPRLLFLQPYALGGAGLKNEHYSFDDDGLGDAFPSDRTDFTLHFGLGADLQFGRLGIMAEATDHMTVGAAPFGRHDTFVMAGLRIRLF